MRHYLTNGGESLRRFLRSHRNRDHHSCGAPSGSQPFRNAESSVVCLRTLDILSSSVGYCRSSNCSNHFERISRSRFFKAISAGLLPAASSQL
jgi:hypothetical protein